MECSAHLLEHKHSWTGFLSKEWTGKCIHHKRFSSMDIVADGILREASSQTATVKTAPASIHYQRTLALAYEGAAGCMSYSQNEITPRPAAVRTALALSALACSGRHVRTCTCTRRVRDVDIRTRQITSYASSSSARATRPGYPSSVQKTCHIHVTYVCCPG